MLNFLNSSTPKTSLAADPFFVGSCPFSLFLAFHSVFIFGALAHDKSLECVYHIHV